MPVVDWLKTERKRISSQQKRLILLTEIYRIKSFLKIHKNVEKTYLQDPISKLLKMFVFLAYPFMKITESVTVIPL